jgi:hypothetical protein
MDIIFQLFWICVILLCRTLGATHASIHKHTSNSEILRYLTRNMYTSPLLTLNWYAFQNMTPCTWISSIWLLPHSFHYFLFFSSPFLFSRLGKKITCLCPYLLPISWIRGTEPVLALAVPPLRCHNWFPLIVQPMLLSFDADLSPPIDHCRWRPLPSYVSFTASSRVEGRAQGSYHQRPARCSPWR